MDGGAIPSIEFAEARGARIAYQRWGSGPPVVAIPPAAQNIEIAWEWPSLRAMFERFGSFCDYVHFDKRGTGSSDRAVRIPHVDDRVDDLRAVMDAAGFERAHLFAQSEGGVTTLLFAHAYPHRVESIILLGSAANMAGDLDEEQLAVQIERREAYSRVWGTPDSWSVGIFAPSMLDDEEFVRWFQRYERLSAGQESLRDLFVQMLQMDATDVIAELDVPLLIMHRVGDQAMPVEQGREMAELARDATFIELSGNDHYGFIGDVDEWMDPMERWVTGTVRERPERPIVSDPSAVRVTTLGRFGVAVDGREVETAEWGSRRARTLLKRLVLARGWPVTRDELFDVLWPGETDRNKLGARLSVQLSHVRRVLGGGVIADRDTVSIDRSYVSSDLDELLDSDDDERIVELDAGDLLPEDRYDDWTAASREQVRATVLAAIRRRLAVIEADGGTDSPEAIRLAARHDELAALG